MGDDGEIFAGHARFEANKLLHKTHVPAICISHLSKAEVRAYMLADNRLAANAGWDREQLAIEFEELQAVLPEIGINLDITGFDPLRSICYWPTWRRQRRIVRTRSLRCPRVQ